MGTNQSEGTAGANRRHEALFLKAAGAAYGSLRSFAAHDGSKTVEWREEDERGKQEVRWHCKAMLAGQKYQSKFWRN